MEARYFARITAKRPHIDRNSRDCASERLFQNPDDFNFTGLYLSSDGLFLSLSLSLPFSVVKMGLIEERSGEFTIFAPLFLLFFFSVAFEKIFTSRQFLLRFI